MKINSLLLKSTLLLFVLCLNTYAWGQISSATINSSPDTKTLDGVVDSTKKTEPIYAADIMPSFPGGENGLFEFIRTNLRYPREAMEKSIEGRVSIRFVVTETGNVEDVIVFKPLSPLLDAEAVRVVKMMPKWTPGKLKGKNVPVYFILPMMFKLGR